MNQCNLEKGTMRAAVDGVEIARYTHPHPGERHDPETRIIPGPIGLFRHGAGASEYKDIYVEVNPKSDRLLTVRRVAMTRPIVLSVAEGSRTGIAVIMGIASSDPPVELPVAHDVRQGPGSMTKDGRLSWAHIAMVLRVGQNSPPARCRVGSY